MGNFITDLMSLLSAEPIVAGLALLALLSVLSLGLLVVFFRKPIPARRVLLIGIAVGIPIMTPMLVTSQKASFFPMNLSIADVMVLPAVLYLLYSLLKRNKPLQLPLFWLFLAYFLWTAISLYVGCHKLRVDFISFSTLVDLAKFLVLFVYFYLVLNLVEDLEDIKTFLKAWIVAGTVVGLIGSGGAILYQLFHIDTFAAGEFRAMGTLGNPNMFAGYMTQTFFLTYIYMVLGGRRGLCIVFMISHGIAILLSASKGSVAAFLVGVFTLLLFMPRHRAKIVAFGVLVVLATTALYFTSEDSRVYIDRILSITDLDSQSHERRYTLWEKSLKVWQENYLFGVGRGNFSAAFPEDALLQPGGAKKWDALGIADMQRDYAVSHSSYLSLLCEMGLPGLLGFLIIQCYFVLLILRRLLRMPSSDASSRTLAAFLAAVMSWLAHAGVANVENSRALWASLGIILAYELRVLRKDSSRF